MCVRLAEHRSLRALGHTVVRRKAPRSDLPRGQLVVEGRIYLEGLNEGIGMHESEKPRQSAIMSAAWVGGALGGTRELLCQPQQRFQDIDRADAAADLAPAVLIEHYVLVIVSTELIVLVQVEAD